MVVLTIVIIDMTANNIIPIIIAFRRDSESPVNKWDKTCMHVNNAI